MKNKILNNQEQKDKIVHLKQAEIEKKKQYLGTMFIHKNHKLFKYDKNTGELKIVEIKRKTFEFNKKEQSNFELKVDRDSNVIYFACLNKKNAIRILKNEYGIIYKST